MYQFHFDCASALFSNHMGKQGGAEAAVRSVEVRGTRGAKSLQTEVYSEDQMRGPCKDCDDLTE